MRHISNWTDLYGAAHASFEGRSGGHRWLVALPAAAGEAALDAALSALTAADGKGRTDLVVFGDAAAVPAAAREIGARGVLLLEAEAAQSVPTPASTDPSTLEGAEQGQGDEAEGTEDGGEQSTDPVAAAPAHTGPLGTGPGWAELNLRHAAAAQAQAALESWMDEVPHGR